MVKLLQDKQKHSAFVQFVIILTHFQLKQINNNIYNVINVQIKIVNIHQLKTLLKNVINVKVEVYY